MSNQKQSIPPHISGLFYNLLGQRNIKVADFKLLTMKGSEDIVSTSSLLSSTLKDITDIEKQLETLLEFYPDLNESDQKPNSVVPDNNPIGADSQML
jgi:hypothetical protein